MAIPSTTTNALLFSSQEPAWERGVELALGQSTRVFTSRSGLEQRQQGRMRSQLSLRYSAFFDPAGKRIREERNRAEIANPVVVPFWSEAATIGSMTTNAATISRTATPDWFVIGDYVYITDGTDAQFRIISGYGVSLQALQFEAMTGSITFAASSLIYPCRICVRDGGSSESMETNDFSTMEEVRYTTL